MNTRGVGVSYAGGDNKVIYYPETVLLSTSHSGLGHNFLEKNHQTHPTGTYIRGKTLSTHPVIPPYGTAPAPRTAEATRTETRGTGIDTLEG